jgi:4-aminobutyrate aminotransferase-like enzyme
MATPEKIAKPKTNFAKVKKNWPSAKSKKLLKKWHQYEADVVGYQAPVIWDKAKGCIVEDVDGNKYIDWTSGVLVTNIGHCHKHLVSKVCEVSKKLLNNYECSNPYRIEASQRLVKALPDHLDSCFFLSTGSEAVEAGVRLMKRFTGNYEVISFEGAFHGRTMHAASIGGMSGPKFNYGPTLPGVIRACFPYPYRDTLGFCHDGPDYTKYFSYLDGLIAANSTGSLAGLVVEPYQGAAGFVFPPVGWLKCLEKWARN